MQARHAARELALIVFSQCNENILKLDKENYIDILLKSVRTLTNNATSELKVATSCFFEIKEFLEQYENNHEDNMKRPIGAHNIEVPLPTTLDMREKLEDLINVADKAVMALEIAEMSVLEEKDDVRDYVVKLALNYRENKNEIDGLIKKYAYGWNIERLVKIDKDILRIAICELVYIKDAPVKVVVDEAIELAKKYSTGDSASFINGILGSVISEYNLKFK